MIHDSTLSKLMIFRFIGNAWLGLSLNKLSKGPKWHLQVKVNSHSRSDTMRPNRSPVVQMKPFFKQVFKDFISHGILMNIIYIHIRMLCFIRWFGKFFVLPDLKIQMLSNTLHYDQIKFYYPWKLLILSNTWQINQ